MYRWISMCNKCKCYFKHLITYNIQQHVWLHTGKKNNAFIKE